MNVTNWYKMFKTLMVFFFGFPEITFSTVENAHSSLATVMYLVPPKDWVTLGFDPNPSHGVVENLVFFQQTKT